jgi:pyruvate/2-oxoglutarate dehydrogenase complex dihydrolipoamide dehydrogenase (E3) component
MSPDEIDREWDVIVIGAGPVGENAADRIRKAGLTCAIVERRLVGGECSFYACSPSKALLRPIHATHASERVQGSEGAHVVPAEVLKRRDTWISDLDDSGALGWLQHVGIDLVRGDATIVGERQVEVDGQALGARHAVIVATGSIPAIPDIPGLRESSPWTNREATTSKVIPGRLAILGGGVVACEMAQVYTALGSTVTIVARSKLLGRAELFAGEAVAESLEKQGVSLRLGTNVTRVQRPTPGGEVTVTVDRGPAVVADEVLCAMGREPAAQGLGLSGLGVETDERGYVAVTDQMEAKGVSGDSPWLYAVGDINGISLLTHMGKYQARACGDLVGARAHGAAADQQATTPWADGLGSPQVIFTDPEVASVGLSEHEASARGIRARAVDVPMDSAAGSGLLAEGYQGRARLVVDEAAGTIVGATFVGQDTAELVHAATIAMVGRVPMSTLWHAVPSFPTMSEIWLRLLEEYGL